MPRYESPYDPSMMPTNLGLPGRASPSRSIGWRSAPPAWPPSTRCWSST